MALHTLEDAFVEELRDILNAERQLTKALPKMAKNATDEKLQEAIEHHLEETEGQIERLEQVFKLVGKPARGKSCEAMEGLIAEGKEVMEEDAEEAVRDALLIASAQKVEHYEIAAYGTLCTWAETLGLDEAAELLKQNLEEEKNADETLSQIAAEVNAAAAEGAAAVAEA